MTLFRFFRKGASLRFVNLLGLTVIFISLLLSAAYLRYEYSYDKHHSKYKNIVRLSLQRENEPLDVRIWGNSINAILEQFPEIREVVKLNRKLSPDVVFMGKSISCRQDAYFITDNFFKVFDYPITSSLNGNETPALEQMQAFVSREFAAAMAEEMSLQQSGSLQELVGSNIYIDEQSYLVSGIFNNVNTSHFKTDILLYNPDMIKRPLFNYVYLLLEKGTDIETLEEKIDEKIAEMESSGGIGAIYAKDGTLPQAFIMPVADIHLHSHFVREMENNGNILYVYLIIGANVLLLLVVLFNLWINHNLILLDNQKNWSINRILGAPVFYMIKQELLYSLLVNILSATIGICAVHWLAQAGIISFDLNIPDSVKIFAGFICISTLVSVLPAVAGTVSAKFSKIGNSVKWILVLQYSIILMILVLALGMTSQMKLVQRLQPGAKDNAVMVINMQSESIAQKYSTFKTELLKNPYIKGITSAFQSPGEAVRDGITVYKPDGSEPVKIPVMVVGEDFVPFFDIKIVEGRNLSGLEIDYNEENMLFMNFLARNKKSDRREEYLINRSALNVLGFESAADAVGCEVRLEHGTVDYIDRGVIVGVTDDFYYTGTFNKTEPLLIMQRNLFQPCVMASVNSSEIPQALQAIESVWKEVYPNDALRYRYSFMDELFEDIYYNEVNAINLMYAFAFLCFFVANLGLIIFMVYIVKRRKKEIAIRKVHGASAGNILFMINMYYLKYIGAAFVVAIPISWFILNNWLQRFAYRIGICWWIFVLAALIVVIISVASVSMQSYRAAQENPLKGIKRS